MIKRSFLILVLCCFINAFGHSQNFKAEQQKAVRVKAAYTEKWTGLKSEMEKKGIDANGFELFIRVLKNDKLVEVWLRPKKSNKFMLFKTYAICYYSGTLGPKRKQGDGQVPEGFYNVAVFNPYSSYHLSLGVSYPNASDKILGNGNLGGDIMIHGNCLSIGCIPITDDCIKEVYIMAVEARNNGQATIPIAIFPGKMDEKGMAFLSKQYADNLSLLAFWKNLKIGYDYFENKKQLPKVSVDKQGKYVVN
jgi:murein L,D-transpeptidase YafK